MQSNSFLSSSSSSTTASSLSVDRSTSLPSSISFTILYPTQFHENLSRYHNVTHAKSESKHPNPSHQQLESSIYPIKLPISNTSSISRDCSQYHGQNHPILISQPYSTQDDDLFWTQKRTYSKMICFSCKSRKSPRWHRTYVVDKKGIFEICNACYIRMKKYQMLCQCCHFAATTKLINNGICPRCRNPFVNLFDRFPPKFDPE